MNNIIAFRTEEQFKTITNNLKQQGYEWANGSEESFETIKNRLPKQTRVFAICFYYNETTKKLELQYQSLNFYKKTRLLKSSRR